MEGNRPLTLRKPLTPSYDSAGQLIGGEYEDIEVFGLRNDRTGVETERLDVGTAIGRTSWRVRSDGIEDIDTSWKLTDDKGRDANIVFVAEAKGRFVPGAFLDIYVENVSV